MPTLINNPGKKNHSYVSDQNPLIVLVSVITRRQLPITFILEFFHGPTPTVVTWGREGGSSYFQIEDRLYFVISQGHEGVV